MHYLTENEDDFIFHGANKVPAPSKKPVSLVILTTELESKKNSLAPTVKKMMQKSSSLGFKCIIINTSHGEIERTETGSFFIRNKGSQNKYEIDVRNTVVLARRSSINSTGAVKFFEKLESLGFVSVNSLKSVLLCEDKLDTVQKLQEKGISTPKTALVSSEEDIENAVKKVGGIFPIVVKLLSGTKGIGVFQVDSIASLLSTLQTIWKLSPQTELILQEKIEADYDLRIHVVGTKNSYNGDNYTIIASMRRNRIENDFRTNVSLGGQAESVEIPEEIENIAIEAAKATECSWCGVDVILEKNTGQPYVLEVNASPGTDGIETATGLDVTGIILDFILNKKNWNYPRKMVGFREMFEVKGIGNFVGKLDTGNGALACSLHADFSEEADGFLNWTIGGKSYSNRIIEYSYAEVGDQTDKRPVILLDIEFGEMVYKKVKFSLVDRINKSTPILINRALMEMAGLVVDSSKTFILTKEPSDYSPLKSKGNALGGIYLF
jgi:RimK family alpha-L-glutamate ligase